MTKGRRPIFPRPAATDRSRIHILDEARVEDIRRNKKLLAEYLKIQWEYYSELAHQRTQVHDELLKILTQSSISNFPFKNWQRAVKYKYSLHPLSTTGSITFNGGRFNAGDGINPAIAPFPALYIGIDKDTALQELLGQAGKKSRLSSQELALTNPLSTTMVSVSGELEKVFDLRSAKHLDAFVALTKGFKLSQALKDATKALGLRKPLTVAQTSKELLETLLRSDWRVAPAQNDVPANSQIFGLLIHQAGIEGILYPSKLTGKDCLAIFPNNFAVTSSYIELDDELPDPKVPRRIDSTSWRVSTLSPREVIDGKTGI